MNKIDQSIGGSAALFAEKLCFSGWLWKWFCGYAASFNHRLRAAA